MTDATVVEDLQKGLVDRVPLAADGCSAVLVGRTVTDLGFNAISIAVMALTGLVVGWRISSSPGEAVGGASFIVISSLTFVASTSVPLESVLRTFAEMNPVDGAHPGRPRRSGSTSAPRRSEGRGGGGWARARLRRPVR